MISNIVKKAFSGKRYSSGMPNILDIVEYCNKLNNEEDIFKETKIDFIKIKILFEENWIKRIDKNFII